MKTALTPLVQQMSWSEEADHILRSCVHCGFCTAVCPTYQLLGNELDGPRGRIYLIKSMLEGHPVTQETQLHLDQCLTCRSCETACPSGVAYGKLVAIGREQVEQKVKRSWWQRSIRWGIHTFLPYPTRFNKLVRLGQLARPLLPKNLQIQIPLTIPQQPWPTTAHPRSMLALGGCVQSSLAPTINLATARVLDHLGIHLIEISTCCGALDYHLANHNAGLTKMRQFIDLCWSSIERHHIEAIVMTASGCGSFVKEYGDLLRHDADYAEKALKISQLTVDLSELLARENTTKLQSILSRQILPKIAVHVPCSLQHAQKISGLLESLLIQLGFSLTPVANAHLCCGSAGTYSILNKTIAQQLLTHKLEFLQAGKPQWIVTANIGCQMHLQSRAEVPVKHWIELVADFL